MEAAVNDYVELFETRPFQQQRTEICLNTMSQQLMSEPIVTKILRPPLLGLSVWKPYDNPRDAFGRSYSEDQAKQNKRLPAFKKKSDGGENAHSKVSLSSCEANMWSG